MSKTVRPFRKGHGLWHFGRMEMVEKIRLLIDKKGWTQTAFESAAMLSANRISKWASGQGEPTARQALRMSRLLEVPVEFLIDDSQDEAPKSSLSDSDRAILATVRSLGLEMERAIEALHAASREGVRGEVPAGAAADGGQSVGARAFAKRPGQGKGKKAGG